jgi:hypothetical protein
LLNNAGSLMVKDIDIKLWPKHEPIIVTLLWFSIIAYVVCMATPFVPGIEMGIALMTMLPDDCRRPESAG